MARNMTEEQKKAAADNLAKAREAKAAKKAEEEAQEQAQAGEVKNEEEITKTGDTAENTETAKTEEENIGVSENEKTHDEELHAEETKAAVNDEKEQEKPDDLLIQQVLKDNAALRAELEEMKKAMVSGGAAATTVANTERVRFIWQAEVADDNVLTFGDNGMYGSIVGKSGEITVPKNELSRVLNAQMRLFLDKRWLIIASGLDEEEREALRVNYKENEILDKKAFGKLVELGDMILNIYPDLCEGHKEMVEKRYYEAFKAGNANVTRERVVALNAMARAAGIEKSAFTKILEEMNEKDAE